MKYRALLISVLGSVFIMGGLQATIAQTDTPTSTPTHTPTHEVTGTPNNDLFDDTEPTATSAPPQSLRNAVIAYRDGYAISLVNADSRGQQKIVDDRGYTFMCPAWSPDGNLMAMVAGSNGFELDVMSGYGGGLRPITFKTAVPQNKQTPTPTPIAQDIPAAVPSWSPDGKQIVYAGQNADALFVVGVDGKSFQRIEGASFYSVDWSPDGSQFVSFAKSPDGKTGIYTLKADGTGLTLLLELPASDLTSSVDSANFFSRAVVQPRWSPDGTKIVFASQKDNPNMTLYMMDADGKNVTAITDGATPAYAPAWSPDGQYLAYVGLRSGIKGIYVTDFLKNSTLGGSPRLVTNLSDGGCPTWKPAPKKQ